ncbi:hypothetical protein BGZ46_003375 [Entomortierella lignicola]|nr:hypothetical protein BGZ46_003375 [Entomortierella lignicola]
MNSHIAPMQVFEFQADSSVSLVSTAAINRKSCDHCFLNRKTCDKVRQAADTGEKCKRCAKDNRPCTFTPTVHLYHIADCVGRHQCRAKVIQAMGGGIKKDADFKTIEIPIVCDMNSDIDKALYEYIQKNPNLLVYNNRFKSFLAQDMLGISPDQDAVYSTSSGQTVPNFGYPQTPSPSNNMRRSVSSEQIPYSSGNNPLTSPIQGPIGYRTKSPIDPMQQQYAQHTPQQSHRVHPYAPYANHHRNNSEDRGHSPIRPSHSPRAHPISNMGGIANISVAGNQISPNASPISLSPLDSATALSFDQRRQSGGFAAAMTVNPYDGTFSQQIQMPLQQAHPYSQQSPYPQAQFFQQVQFPQQQQQQQQQQYMNTYRTPSPFSQSPVAPSPIQQYSPQPPSPLDLALTINAMSNNSQQNLSSLFDTTLSMGAQSQSPQLFHRRQPSTGSISVSDAGSPAMNNTNQESAPPMVITTTNEEGNEVGFYYAVPAVSLNPGASDADLFQDFTVMEDTLGENFVWVENLFDENAVVGDGSITNSALSSAIPIPGANTDSMTMEGLLASHHHQQQHDDWSSNYTPQDSFNGNLNLQG